MVMRIDMDKLKKLDKRLYIVFGVVIILLVFLCALIIKKTYSISDTTSLADVNINENITFSDVKISTTDSVFKYSGYLTSNKDISDVNYINIIPEDEAGNTLATLVDYIGTNIVAGVKKEISASTNKVVLTSMHDIRYEIVKNDGSVIKVSETSLASTTTTTTTNTTTTNTLCDGKVYEFDYTGAEQTFSPDCDGYYELETWGAQGGSGNGTYFGGYGGYSTGVISIDSDTNLYINVGGSGSTTTAYHSTISGGYNGGGAGAFDTSESANIGEHGFAGGGATDFRIAGSTLNDRVMVAAGGGGGGWSGNGSSDQYYMYGGGAGGALTGIAPGGSSSYIVGTQVSGNAFGVGGSGRFELGGNNNGTGGGGGGFYGGGSGLSFTKPNSSGSGGSSFISGYLGSVAITSSTDTSQKSIDTSIRYIEVGSAGNNVNEYNHIVELQAYDETGNNVALNKKTVGSDMTIPTDGYTNSGTYADLGTGSRSITIDLGAEYNIKKVKLWRYYADSRVYYNTYIKAYNADKTKSIYFHNYSTNGTYIESSSGATFYNCNNGSNDVACSYHYSGLIFTNTNMIAGNTSMPTHDGTGTMTGNSGNGYARITYIGSSLN
jgi:hypothetical protein